MDINTFYEALKDNGWSAVLLLIPFFVNLLGMLTASKLEKQMFKPKQKIYTKSFNLVLHTITATIIAFLVFLVMGVVISDVYLLLVIFSVYFIVFLVFLPILEAIYKPDYYIEDDKLGKLYIQNVDTEGKLILYSEPNPNKKDGFYIIKEDSSILLNTKIHTIRKDQYYLTKSITKWLTKPFKKKIKASP